MRRRETPRLILLGLNAYGHDAAAALLVDGRLVFAAQQERYDRVRNSPGFPTEAIREALAVTGVAPSDIEGVCFPWTRGMARARKALHVLLHLPRSLAFLKEPPDALLPTRAGYLRAMRSFRHDVRALDIRAKIHRVPHHVAHAASTALVLPDATGAAVTADGMGEWTTAALWRITRGLPSLLMEVRYPHSPGKAYAAVTSWLGFRPEADEGKTMGLAAYGDPDAPAARFTRSLLGPHPARLLTVDWRKFGFPWGQSRLYGDAFLAELGPPRGPDEPLRDHDAHAARGIQDAVEAWALFAAREALSRTGASALSLSGGLFLNCAANGALHRALNVPVLPFPVAGDAGAAVGAAAWVHRRLTGEPALPLSTLRLAHDIDDREAVSALGSRPAPRLEPASLARAVAERLLSGRLVGVARGRAELGPRALGARSVLARADSPAVRDLLNARKGREAWRPVAPVVRDEDTARWFHKPASSPWMILTLAANDEAAKGPLRGAVHRDGTCRIQTVAANDDPFLHALLSVLVESGQAAVLNTSLNRRGEPIVNTASEAISASEAMGLDSLVLSDRLVDLAPRRA